MGQIFQVQYILKVYLKHDGFFERGQGTCVNLPLRIMATPRMEPSTEPWRVPDQWEPFQGNQEPTYVFLANPDEKPEYVTKYIERNWAKWEENISPVLAAAEESDTLNIQRRKTMKMCEDDPDDGVKDGKQTSPSPFSKANSPGQGDVSHAGQMFSHLPASHPYNKGAGLAEIPKEPEPVAQFMQPQPVPQAEPEPAAQESFYKQFLKGAAKVEKPTAQEAAPDYNTNYQEQQQPASIYYDDGH